MKKVVHLKRALPLICNALNLQKFLNISVEVLPKKAKFQAKNCRNNTCAFSLVEMLMALLAASLLMAALAPVMTKKFKENVHINATGISNASNFRIFQYEDCEAKADNTAVCVFTVQVSLTPDVAPAPPPPAPCR